MNHPTPPAAESPMIFHFDFTSIRIGAIVDAALSGTNLTDDARATLADVLDGLPPYIGKLIKHATNQDLTPALEAQRILKATQKFIDDAFDGLPEWSSLTEAQRDEIVKGFTTFGMFLASVIGKSREVPLPTAPGVASSRPYTSPKRTARNRANVNRALSAAGLNLVPVDQD